MSAEINVVISNMELSEEEIEISIKEFFRKNPSIFYGKDAIGFDGIDVPIEMFKIIDNDYDFNDTFDDLVANSDILKDYTFNFVTMFSINVKPYHAGIDAFRFFYYLNKKYHCEIVIFWEFEFPICYMSDDGILEWICLNDKDRMEEKNFYEKYLQEDDVNKIDKEEINKKVKELFLKLKDNIKGTLINKEEKIIWKPQKEFEIIICLCYAPGKDYINFKYKEIYIEIYYKNSFIKSEYIEDENIYEYIKHLNEEESLIELEEKYDIIRVEKEYREIDNPYSRYNF